VLAALLNTPKTDEDWARFSFHHRSSHEAIRVAIAANRGVSLPSYSLDPIPFNAFQQWLEWNQQAHTDMNNVLQRQGTDLEDVNAQDERQWRAWVYLHFLEHQTAETTLGIAS
jgi:hypothetical protein